MPAFSKVPTYDLPYLLDRQKIEDAIYDYPKGVDRHDNELIAAAFHPDGWDDHGSFFGTVPEFVSWVNGVHEDRTRAHTHNITCHFAEIDGNVATTESYLIWGLRLKDDKTLMLGSARYLDRVEKRDGVWKIALRRTVTEMRMHVDGSLWSSNWGGYQQGSWDKSDVFYQHPLALPPADQAKLAEKTPPPEGAKSPPAAGRTRFSGDAEAIRYLADRRAIKDCILRYCRGLDRHDRELLTSAYWPDAVDNHHAFVGYIPEFVEWGIAGTEERYLAHTHNITCHMADIQGDEAHTESYVIFMLRERDTKTVSVGGGRYIDRLERRGGEWRIALRRMIVDWRFQGDGTVFNTGDGYLHGTRDQTDLSYLRPFGVSPEQAAIQKAHK